jgi:hypothetical protein
LLGTFHRARHERPSFQTVSEITHRGICDSAK